MGSHPISYTDSPDDITPFEFNINLNGLVNITDTSFNSDESYHLKLSGVSATSGILYLLKTTAYLTNNGSTIPGTQTDWTIPITANLPGGGSTLDSVFNVNLIPPGTQTFNDIHFKIEILPNPLAAGSSLQWSSASIGVDADTITSIPEPLTMLGSAAAVGFVAAFKRRLAKVTKEDKNS